MCVKRRQQLNMAISGHDRFEQYPSTTYNGAEGRADRGVFRATEQRGEQQAVAEKANKTSVHGNGKRPKF